jgi:hypothetical protein
MILDHASKYFWKGTTDEMRAVFEATISLTMLYHKLIGMPISYDADSCRAIEKAMVLSATKQPFKTEVIVRIDEKRIKEKVNERKKGPYSYIELDGSMFELHVKAEYGSAYAKVGMKYIEELDYPLMYIEEAGKVNFTR